MKVALKFSSSDWHFVDGAIHITLRGHNSIGNVQITEPYLFKRFSRFSLFGRNYCVDLTTSPQNKTSGRL
jgi:hypothetical protein